MGQRFSAAGVESARRVAEDLLAHLLGCKPLQIYARPPAEAAALAEAVEPLAARIEAGEPLQYVVGHVDFHGLEIKCDPRALIPRPETELLADEMLSSDIWNRASARIVDVGTGTGCIVLSLAQQHPEACFMAIDLSAGALALARENARAYGLEERIEWRQSSLLDGLAATSTDAVVANLPYIDSEECNRLDRSVRDHEPRSALDGGIGGMELIERLAAQARTVLRPGGTLFLEFGYDQGAAVAECLRRHGYADIRIRQDLAGHDRIAIAGNPVC